jgi:phospholipase/carboxylesterase
MSDDAPLESVGGPAACGAPFPVVACHGRGQDETALAGLTDRLPDRTTPVRVRAPHSEGDGYRWYETTLPSGSHDLSQPEDEGFRESVDRLHDYCDALGRPVGLLGYSQGAMTCLAAVVERPAAYRWVGALHGYLPASHSSPTLVRRTDGIPAFVGYGRTDSAIPSWRSRRTVATLAAGGADVTEAAYDCGHELTADQLADVARWVEGVTPPARR